MKQLELPIRSRSAVLVLLALFGSNDVALAVNNIWQGPNLGDWRTDANWSVAMLSCRVLRRGRDN